ncbi:MAG: hypothetical protein H6719_04725 [Sandaracinaceae bacterium]|nr:hypothetical protein [Sandaracinaceae bacterium]
MRHAVIVCVLATLVACGSSDPEAGTGEGPTETSGGEPAPSESSDPSDPIGHATEPVFETDELNAQSDAIMSTYAPEQCCCAIAQGDIMHEDLVSVTECEQAGECVRVDPRRIAPHACCPGHAAGERCNGDPS